MHKKLQKSLQIYISKIKKQTSRLQFLCSSIFSRTSTACKILPSGKHPKRLSFTAELNGEKDHDKCDEAATLEDIDKFLCENFKSLYGQDNGHNNDYGLIRKEGKRKGKESRYRPILKEGEILLDSPKFFTPLDLCRSQRFFIIPISSGSLLEEVGMLSRVETYTSDDVGSSSTCTGNTTAHIPHYVNSDTSTITSKGKVCIAVLTVSSSPYEDFRRSMQEIVEARVHNSQRVDWDFMEGLLFCYLSQNEKKQYRYILSAFVDLIVVLRQNSCYKGPKGHIV